MFDVQCMSNFISVSDICGNPILPILLDHPIQIQFNSFKFFLGGGGPLFSFVNFLCVTFVNQYVDFRGFWRVRKRQ